MNYLLYKRKRCHAALFILLVVLLPACAKHLLDTVPDTTISDVTAFDTPDRIAAQVNSLYASIKNGSFYGGGYLIYDELRADEFLMGKPDPGQASNVWQHTVNSGSTEVLSLWSAGFSAINAVNSFLAGLETHKAVVTDALYTQYVAEAKFIRAISYFALVQTYAKPYNADNGASLGLPLRLKSETSSADNNLARSTVAEIYTQILSDLDAAETDLPDDYGDDFTNATKAHKNTAIAFKTRVDLHKGDYAGVKTEAEKIVSLTSSPIQAPSGVAHQLEADYTALWTGDYTGPEAIFSMPFTDADAGSLITYYFRAPPAPGSEYYLNPAGILSNPALSDPADARSAMIVSSQGFQWLNKYTTPTPNTDYVPVMRYAEVLLNYAEAAVRTNDLATGATLLNAVRRRSDPSYTFASGDLGSSATLLPLILTERRIELLGEGFRTHDVQRQLLPIPGKTAPSGTSPALDISTSLYIWPISSEEMGANKLMVQNP